MEVMTYGAENILFLVVLNLNLIGSDHRFVSCPSVILLYAYIILLKYLPLYILPMHYYSLSTAIIMIPLRSGLARDKTCEYLRTHVCC